MAGLIMGGIGQGIANAGNAIGLIGVRDYEMRQAHALREDERQNQRDWQEQQRQDQREWQAGQNEIYRRTAAQQNAGKGTGGDGISGFDPKDLEPGGKLSPYMAARVGMSTEDYEKQVTAMKTKDMSGYATETRDIGKVLDDEYGEQTVTQKVVPEAFKKEFAAKAKVISDLVMNYAAGKEAKTIAEGEQIGLVTGAVKGVLEGTVTPTKAAQATAVGKGIAPFGGDSNVTRNVLEGNVSVTPVGESQITENKAQAGAQNKLAEKHGEEITKIREEVKKIQAEIPEVNARTKKIEAETGEVGKDKKGQTQERLSTVINSANATLKSLDDNGPGKTEASKALWQKQRDDAIALRDEAIALQKEALGARAAPPAATGTSTSGGAPKKVTKAEYDALPSGAKYIDPTGQIRTKK
jgi:hypothetical protein